ncbi:RrF2 family transcriptional regulator [Candidatus Nitrospira salsa]
MKKFSQKVTYAIMATLELGIRYGATPVQAKAIAHNQSIPARFIEHILSALKQAGLVTSHRGAQGGYILSKEPAETSLAEIVQAMDGSTTLQLNGSTNGHQETPNAQDALLSGIWQQLHDAELAILHSISLQTLLDRYQELEDKRVLMYHI